MILLATKLVGVEGAAVSESEGESGVQQENKSNTAIETVKIRKMFLIFIFNFFIVNVRFIITQYLSDNSNIIITYIKYICQYQGEIFYF